MIQAYALSAINELGRSRFPLRGAIIAGYRFYLRSKRGRKADSDALNKIAWQDDSQIIGWLGWPLHGKLPVDHLGPRTEIEIMTTTDGNSANA